MNRQLEPPVEELARAIGKTLAAWHTPHVELAIYGSAEPELVAQTLNAHCQRELGSGVARTLFYRTSIGAVAGVRLQDGRGVVIKAHPPDWSFARLQEIAALQSHVAERLRLAPHILAGPTPLGNGFALTEQYLLTGESCDPHQPSVCRELARSLYALVETLRPWVESSELPPLLVTSAVTDELWPTPHSKLFDFDATRAGAAAIDAVARAARARMTPVGATVIGHGDWRAEHVRFAGGQAVLGFDWDSLCKETEPALVGFTAHAFCADWSRRDHQQAPSLDEARSFVDEYERVRGRPFSHEERESAGACFAYSVAYTARCAHALGNDDRQRPGTFQHLLATHEPRLMAL